MTTWVYGETLDIPHRCSFKLKIFYVGIFGVIFAAIFFADISIALQITFLVIVTLCGLPVWRLIKTLSAIEKILVRNNGLQLVMGERTLPVEIVGNSIALEWLMTITCRPERGTWKLPIYLVLLSDSLDSENHRLLRVLLKTGKLKHR